jgi:hypothetical protein
LLVMAYLGLFLEESARMGRNENEISHGYR